MTTTKRAEIDNIGFNVGTDVALQGQIAIRWAKLTYDDSALLARENHRALLNPGDDIDAVMAAVNSDLSAQGYGSMPDSDIALVKSQTQAMWTPEVVSAYQAKVAAEKSAEEAKQAAISANAAKYLDPWRFWAVANVAFPNDGLRTAIKAGITDPVAQAVALAKLDNPPGGQFFRDDPLFSDAALMTALGKTSADIDALWAQGQALPA